MYFFFRRGSSARFFFWAEPLLILKACKASHSFKSLWIENRFIFLLIVYGTAKHVEIGIFIFIYLFIYFLKRLGLILRGALKPFFLFTFEISVLFGNMSPWFFHFSLLVMAGRRPLHITRWSGKLVKVFTTEINVQQEKLRYNKKITVCKNWGTIE